MYPPSLAIQSFDSASLPQEAESIISREARFTSFALPECFDRAMTRTPYDETAAFFDPRLSPISPMSMFSSYSPFCAPSEEETLQALSNDLTRYSHEPRVTDEMRQRLLPLTNRLWNELVDKYPEGETRRWRAADTSIENPFSRTIVYDPRGRRFAILLNRHRSCGDATLPPGTLKTASNCFLCTLGEITFGVRTVESFPSEMCIRNKQDEMQQETDDASSDSDIDDLGEVAKLQEDRQCRQREAITAVHLQQAAEGEGVVSLWFCTQFLSKQAELEKREYFSPRFSHNLKTLKEDRQVQLTQDHVLSIDRQMRQGLEGMHAKGIAHRDVHEKNILVDVSMEPEGIKLTVGWIDFGRACSAQETTGLESEDESIDLAERLRNDLTSGVRRDTIRFEEMSKRLFKHYRSAVPSLRLQEQGRRVFEQLQQTP